MDPAEMYGRSALDVLVEGIFRSTRFLDLVRNFVLFEHIGPETWPKNFKCLAKLGRMVTCGATSGCS